MQYSPNNAIMYVSMVDAGTVEFLRSLGKQIVSSADLVSQFEAVLSEEQIASHVVAQRAIDAHSRRGWQEMGRRCVRRRASRVRAHRVRHGAVAQRGHAARRPGLGERPQRERRTPTAPTRTTSPPPEHSAPIREGDFVLIDIWGRVNKPDSIFYDITWTGVVGREPTEREQHVSSRRCATRATRPSRPCEKAFADRPADPRLRGRRCGPRRDSRSRLRRSTSPTAPGHNIAHEMHGPGAHLDNLETHDERRISAPHLLLRRAGHLSAGVRRAQRSEHADGAGKAWVTGKIQRELVRI